MASDSQDSRRKHRRSPSDDDSAEDSKRHKHRHHRHHHRRHRHHHHHRHGSKKHDYEEVEGEERERKAEIEPEIVSRPPPAADYDMEEGEIVEDEGVLVVANAEDAAADKKAGSDVESGEFRAVEGPTEFDDSFRRVDNGMASPGSNHSLSPKDKSRKCSKNLKSPDTGRSDGSKKLGSRHQRDESPMLDIIINGDSGKKSKNGESRLHTIDKSPSRGSSKQKVQLGSGKRQSLDLMEVDEDEYGDRRNSSSSKVRDNLHKASSRSPSHVRYHLETGERSRSQSLDRVRRRERSQSILHEGRSRMRHGHDGDEGLYVNGKMDYELDDERDKRVSTCNRFASRDVTKDKERDRTSSHYRSSMREGEHEDGDSWDRQREEKVYKEMKKAKQQEPRRDKNERDNDRDIDREKEPDRGSGRDREREKSDRDREKARETKGDMDWDRERDRERKRENDRGRSRDRDYERERRRDSSISTYRDRDAEREWNKVRDRDRKLETDRGRDRTSGRDRHRDKTRDVESDRSRRYHTYDDRDGKYGDWDRRHGYDEPEYHRDRDRKRYSENDRSAKDVSLKENEDGGNKDDVDQKDYQERVELELAEKEEDDIERIKEESRRRREAILQKYKAQQSQQQAVSQSATVSNEEAREKPSQNLATTTALQENIDVKSNGRDSSAVEKAFTLGKSPLRNETTADEKNTGAGGLGEGTPKSERSNDMFCDDIFGDSPAGVRKTGKGDGLPIERSGLHDNWDDPEGYYSFRFGEILDSRYEITAAHGKGVFSTVVRAKDLKAGSGDPEEVAIKIIRNNETMLKAGTEELVILKKLVGADPDDRRHCVRFLSHFKYRNHLCIVFESLHMNLREVLKKFGRNIGLKLTAVRAYAKQLFIALKHLRNCGVLHCDIKPDNMLVNDAKNVLKLCDFGNAMFAGKNEITPYLVSRFYRAPEIILGLPYDHPMDIWSVGCCLYELYTGKVLFPGPTNNDMLRLHMELKGPFPKKMLRKGAFIEQHFDQDLNFLATEEDPVTKKAIRRLICNIKPKDIGTIIKGSPGEDPKMLANFKDLLDKIFVLDPDKRLTVSQALNHPFITGK